MVVGFVVSGVYAAGLLRGRDRRAPPPRFHGAVRLRDGGRRRPADRRSRTRHAGRRHTAGEAGGVRACRDDRGACAVSAGRRADRRRGAVGVGDTATRLDHRAQLVRQPGARAGHGARVRLAAGQHHPSGVPVDGRSSARCWRLAVVVFWLLRWRGHDLLDNRWFLRFSVIAGPLAVLARRTRLGRHRSRPSTVDGVADASDHRRGQHEPGPVVELPRRPRHLSGHDRRARTSCCVPWRGGGVRVRPTCRARTGRRREETVS